jgi:hypothetical protein
MRIGIRSAAAGFVFAVGAFAARRAIKLILQIAKNEINW